MPSQPDYEAAHRLNPKLFPLLPQKQLQEARAMIGYLADELAKERNTSRDEIVAAAVKACGTEKPQLTTSKAPERSEPQTEKEATQDVEKSRAKFFANKERMEFHPIGLRNKKPFKDLTEDEVKYFEDEDEAIANGFEPAKEEIETSEEKTEEKKETKKTTKKSK